MSKQRVVGKAPRSTRLWWVGLWATIWWGLSCIFCLVLVWQSRTRYVQYTVLEIGGYHFAAWNQAIIHTYGAELWLTLLSLLLLGWIVVFYAWMKALREAGVSYRAAAKDLFLTIRK
jgi:hypothetical protein